MFAMEMTPTLTRLKEIATKATPGPWFNCKYTRQIRNFSYEKEKQIRPFHIARYPSRTPNYPISHEMWEANSDFIATFNPTTALKLINALETALEALNFYASEKAWYLQKDLQTGSEVRRSVEYFDTESSGKIDERGNNYLYVIGGKHARQALEKIEGELSA